MTITSPPKICLSSVLRRLPGSVKYAASPGDNGLSMLFAGLIRRVGLYGRARPLTAGADDGPDPATPLCNGGVIMEVDGRAASDDMEALRETLLLARLD